MDIEGNLIRLFEMSVGNPANPFGPTKIALDQEDRMIVLSGASVYVFERDGSFLFSFRSGSLECPPSGVVVDQDGSIVVSLPEKFLIQSWK